MIEVFCPPCPPEIPFSPQAVPVVCPCPDIPPAWIPPTPTITNVQQTEDCFKDLILNMAGGFFCGTGPKGCS